MVLIILQVSPIYAANLLAAAETVGGSGWNRDVMDYVYLLTSDVDVWPISSGIYNLPAKFDMLLLNEVSGTFEHEGVTYQLMSATNIGARVGTWRNISYRLSIVL